MARVIISAWDAKARNYIVPAICLVLAIFICSAAYAEVQGAENNFGGEIRQYKPQQPLPNAPSQPVLPEQRERRGAVNPRTGEYLVPSGEGLINPRTGEYFVPSRNGYYNPRTGEFIPGP